MAALISVIVAVYNGEKFLGDALRSIVGQTLPPHEVCVVDDGSSDGSGEVARGFASVRSVRREQNQGQASALNWGVASTSGEYLAFLDADDVWLASKLEHQAQAFANEPGLDVVYGLMRERVLSPSAALAARDGRVVPACLPSAMLIRRAAFERVGGFDPRWTLGSVVDWYARARDAGLTEHVLPEVVYERRIHGENVGLRRADRQSDYLAVVKAALDRRRLARVAGAALAPAAASEEDEP